MTQTVEWFFGRGLSIGCGLTWAVPQGWNVLSRDEIITRTIAALDSEMSASHVNTSEISSFLNFIAHNTSNEWNHRFHTTNWDYLLQREIGNLGLSVLPKWLSSSHVYHWNGSIEPPFNNTLRSNIVLETDKPAARLASHEGNLAFNKCLWSKTFVVMGMSFECDVDQLMLQALSKHEDKMSMGEAQWIVVNPCAQALKATSTRLRAALPAVTVIEVQSAFSGWLKDGFPQLKSRGAIISETLKL
jgi:hypothetical protein